MSLGAKKEKGEGVEIATQTLSWGSSPYTEMPTQPSVDTSSSGELLFKEATFFSPEDAKGMGEVQVRQLGHYLCLLQRCHYSPA